MNACAQEMLPDLREAARANQPRVVSRKRGRSLEREEQDCRERLMSEMSVIPKMPWTNSLPN